MTNYTKTTDFAAKDSLPSGNAAKIVKGSEIDTEFNNIATASATKANANNAALTGTTTAQTLDISGNVDVDGTLETDALSLNGVTVTSTAAELNYVDGVTSNIQTQLDTKAPLASPTFTGTVTVPGLTTTANVLFGDNDKAIFGAGSDLSIYSDGTQSFIQEDGPGALYIQGTHLNFNNAAGNASYITAVDGGAVTLFSSGSAKLATTSTGIDVTGSVTADGLTVDGVSKLKAGSTSTPADTAAFISNASAKLVANHGNEYGAYVGYANSSNDAIGIQSTRSNGTTAPLSLNPYGGNVGIGTSAPSHKIEIESSSDADLLQVQSTAGSNDTALRLGISGDVATINATGGSTGILALKTYGTERMRIDSSGNVGIGTSIPSNAVTVNSTAGAGIKVYGADQAYSRIAIDNLNGQEWNLVAGTAGVSNSGFGIYDADAGATRLQIDSSGNVGIGTSSPTDDLSVGTLGSGSNSIITIGASTTGTSSIYFGDGAGAGRFRGYFDYVHSSDHLAIGTAAAERMRIDSSGNVLVNTTNAGATGLSVANSSTISFAEGASSSLGNVFRQSNSADLVLASGYKYTDTHSKMASSYASLWAKSAVGVGYGYVRFFTDAASTDSVGTDLTPTERMRIDSLGNVGIGTSSPHSFGTNQSGITISDGTGGCIRLKNDAGSVNFDIENGGGGGINLNSVNAFPLKFSTSNTERMRIDSSGNLLVGKTSAGSSVVGQELRANGYNVFTRDGDTPLELYRKTSDGSLLNFTKDGTTVGSIGTASGTFWIGSGDVGLVFDNATVNSEQIRPYNTASGTRDAAIDLGSAGGRFKDLYLSSAVKFGSQDALATDGSSTYVKANSNIYFQPANSQKMLLDTSGQLLIGCTGQTGDAPNSDGFLFQQIGNVKIRVNSDGQACQQYYSPTGGTSGPVGGITVNASSTAFNTTSDQRAKENIVDAPSASDDIDAIQVRSFDWKADGSHQKYGMVAQELQSVAPEAVSGDADSDEMMAVDYSKLVPMLVKEIQSLRERVQQLENN